ncbi:Ger(x)C family spore germination protein [Caproiciproducens sp. MSJ-32]|uniref:Ger(x)C family spore germination protein n=1 Tax=Caproiciproducens sp. MSJ-32 TaxID=2841527 RepID=UPI001C1187ED|nr:Ger(x)C family spore germination protein [Caproiciproducens sp. MSJ-32]MBU5454973.1 Ger(x)C family spore germination protein [Caproiciproducens sp. MSJ-32]
MKLKKILVAIMILISPTLLYGCFNYNDINKLTFVTSMIFDEEDSDEIVVYVDCIKPYRSSDEGEEKARRIMYRAEGKTAIEALKNVNLISSTRLNYSQNRAYIFTEKAAKSGIEKYLSLINNNQQLSIKPDMFIYYGDLSKLLEVSSKDEEYLGQYLEELINRNKTNPKAVSANMNDYLSKVIEEDDSFIVGSLKIKEDEIGEKIELSGGAILKDHKLVSTMNPLEVVSYNVLLNNITDGILEISNPQKDEGLITVEILGTSVESNIELKDEKIHLIKDIDIKITLAEAQSELIVDDKTLDYIKEETEKLMKNYLITTFEKFKKEELDIFEVKRLLNINYPKTKIENPLANTYLDVNINIIIDGSSLVKDIL